GAESIVVRAAFTAFDLSGSCDDLIGPTVTVFSSTNRYPRPLPANNADSTSCTDAVNLSAGAVSPWTTVGSNSTLILDFRPTALSDSLSVCSGRSIWIWTF